MQESHTQSPRSLVSLDLSRNNFANSADFLSPLLTSSLSSLNLSYCSLSDSEGDAIATSLRPLSMPPLSSSFSSLSTSSSLLSLSSSSLSPDLASSYSSSQSDTHTSLSLLDISENRIGDTMNLIVDSLIQRERERESGRVGYQLKVIKAEGVHMSAAGFKALKAKMHMCTTSILM